MHVYSIDKSRKEVVIFGLTFLAITVTPLVQRTISSIVSYLEFYSWLSSPPAIAIPVFTIFILIYTWFDKKVWKFPFVRKHLLIPDLNGVWKCEGKTVLKEGKQADFNWSGKIHITQTWSHIYIHLSTAQSSSESFSASLYNIPGVGYRLCYQYRNTADVGELELQNHSGSVELVISKDQEHAEGSYFTDRHRTTVGSMTLTKECMNV